LATLKLKVECIEMLPWGSGLSPKIGCEPQAQLGAQSSCAGQAHFHVREISRGSAKVCQRAEIEVLPGSQCRTLRRKIRVPGPLSSIQPCLVMVDRELPQRQLMKFPQLVSVNTIHFSYCSLNDLHRLRAPHPRSWDRIEPFAATSRQRLPNRGNQQQQAISHPLATPSEWSPER